MRTWLSPLLSLLTVVGGHLLNRRLDLVLLFFVLLLISTLAAIYAVPMAVMNSDSFTQGAINSLYLDIVYALAATLSLLIIVSTVVSFSHARRAVALPAVSGVGKIAGLLAVLFSIATLAWAGMTGAFLISAGKNTVTVAKTEADNDTPHSGPIFSRSDFFHESVRYSGHWVDNSALSTIPKGDAYLSGTITYQGRPASGIALRAVLDNRYQTANTTTDKNGVFSLLVPEGEWTVNRIELKEWKNKPHGAFLSATTAHDATLGEGIYFEGLDLDREGLSVMATKKPEPNDSLSISIHDNPLLLFPAKEKQTADIKADSINWQPVEGAVKYQIQLHRVEHNGTSTSYYPVTWMNIDTNIIPLNRFPTVSDDTQSENEYAVKVFAFDDQGRLISGNDFMGRNTLVLKGVKLVKTPRFGQFNNNDNLSPEAFTKQLEATEQDHDRINAARTLVEEDMAAEARTLLERVDTPSLEMEKSAVLGMVLAAEGRCEDAKKHFSDLNKQRGSECTPNYVSQRCPD